MRDYNFIMFSVLQFFYLLTLMSTKGQWFHPDFVCTVDQVTTTLINNEKHIWIKGDVRFLICISGLI